MTPEQIIQQAADLFGLTPAAIVGDRRARHIVAARQAAMLAMHTLTEMSLAEIGRALNRRDHTTVAHGIAAARDRAATDATYAERIAALCRRPGSPPEPTRVRDDLRRAALKIGAMESGEQYWVMMRYGFFEQKASV